MQTEVKISTTSGTIKAPASKSCMQRALAISLLTRGTSVIRNLSSCNDVNAALSMTRSLGAAVEADNEKIIITGTGRPQPVTDIINCGESGLASRLFIPVASLSEKKITIEGHGSLLSRRMDDFSTPLRSLGVEFLSASGFLPVTVQGPMKGGRTTVNGKMSSQFLSGLLIALPVTGAESLVEVTGLESKPYVDITIDIMKMAGVNVINNNYSEFIIKGRQEYHPFDYTVEGDWSGASVFLVMGAISGGIHIKGLNAYSSQADRRILDVISECGADLKVGGDEITVHSAELRPFIFDASDAPDLVPALSVLALGCNGRSVINRIERLRVKESDRVMSISEMVKAIGGSITEVNDSLIIEGGRKLSGGVVDSFNDHRIVMAASAASLLCNNRILIKGTESVNKSYPEFTDHLVRVGASVITN